MRPSSSGFKNRLNRIRATISKSYGTLRLRFSNSKRNLQSAEKEIDRIANLARRRVLARQVSWGRNELRRIEWSVREAAANCFSSIRYFERPNWNGHSPKIRAQSSSSEASNKGSDNSPAPSSSLAKQKAIDSARKRAFLERERAQKKILINILDNAEAIATIEPLSSLPDALRPIANELRAHHNEIKKRFKSQNISPKTNTLTDYWVSWAAVSSLLSGTAMDGRIVKYASKDLKDRVIRISKFAAPAAIGGHDNPGWISFQKSRSRARLR